MARPRRLILLLSAAWFLAPVGACLLPADDEAEERAQRLGSEVNRLSKDLRTLQDEIKALKKQQGGEAAGHPAPEPPGSREEESGARRPGGDEQGFRWGIGGQYRIMLNASDFDYHPLFLGSEKSQAFVNQRFRTTFWISPMRSVEAAVQVEMGHIPWGQDFESTKSFTGPRYPASTDPNGDRVGVEIRRAYLTYRNATVGDFRLGIQDFHDMFLATGDSLLEGPVVDDYRSMASVLANSVWDFNVGGITYHRAFLSNREAELRLAWYALSREGDSLQLADAYLTAFDIDFTLGDEAKLGLSCYYVRDGTDYSYPGLTYDGSDELWLGLRASLTALSIPWNGFFIFNQGWREDPAPQGDWEHSGFAGKLEAGPVALGPGTVSLQAVVATGEGDSSTRHSSEFRTIGQSERDNFGAQGYWSYLIITSPHGPSDVNDLGVSVQNRGAGIITAQAKYSYPIIGVLRGTVAVGWLRSFASNPANGNYEIGWEFGNTFTVDLGSGVTIDFGGAYLVTGGFYEDPAPGSPGPDNLWEVFTRLQVEF